MISKQKQFEKGFVLLLAVLVTGTVLAVAVAILNITLKQFTISGIARNSELAFQAANAGTECLLYWDLAAPNGSEKGGYFNVPGNGLAQASGVTIRCLGKDSSSNPTASGGEQQFEFEWTSDGSKVQCTNASIYKYHSDSADVLVPLPTGGSRTCPRGATCTVIRARGYNESCSNLVANEALEREITVSY